MLGAGYLATGSAFADADAQPRDNAEAVARITEAVVGATAGLEQPKSAAASANVEVPKDPDAPLVITSGPAKITIGLPVSDDAGNAVATSTGTVVYPDASSNANVAVQTLGPSELRALVAIKSSEAPQEYRFPMTLPDGARLAPAPDGSGAVEIVADTPDGSVVLGNVAAPWAKDAKGAAVTTTYRIEGNSLVQTVSHGSGTAYPVIADPKVSFGLRIYVRYSRAEVKDFKAKGAFVGITAMVGAACGKIPVTWLMATCAGAIAVVGGSVLDTFSKGASLDRCVELQFNYQGILLDWKTRARGGWCA